MPEVQFCMKQDVLIFGKMNPENPLILIVDDNVYMEAVFKQFLPLRGYACAFANCADTAFRILSEVQPALIVTDVNMPIVSGVDFAKKLKESEKTAGIPLIFMSGGLVGYTHTDLQQYSPHFIQKVFMLNDFMAKVEEVLSQK